MSSMSHRSSTHGNSDLIRCCGVGYSQLRVSPQRSVGRRSLACLLVIMAVGTAGCLQHRASVLGRTAVSGLGPKTVEASVSPGILYGQTTDPAKVNGSRDVRYTEDTQIPAVEGNLTFGFTEKLGLNLHLSPAGIQPGLKILLLRRWVSIALMPELAFFYWSHADKTDVTKNGYTNTKTTYDLDAIGVTAGTKVLVSTEFGIYGGLGYDFQYTKISSGDGNSDTSNLQHILTFGAGYEIDLGRLQLRPELTITVTPAITTKDGDGSKSGGWSFTLMPNITVAVARHAQGLVSTPTTLSQPPPKPILAPVQ